MDFTIEKVNLGSHLLNRGEATVAIITPQGYVDWLQPGPDYPATKLTSIAKETHLCYVLGTKFNLHFCHLTEEMDSIGFELFGDSAVISAESHSKDDKFKAKHQATITVNPETGLYEWSLRAELLPQLGATEKLDWIEYTNVYPSGTGRCMLFEPEKRYRHTLLEDADGTVWDFPHQHALHYGRKLYSLRFGTNAWAGFFVEDLNPVVSVLACDKMPNWGICDMYYDLHCLFKGPDAFSCDTPLSVKARIHYLDREKGAELLRDSQPIPITAEDYKTHFAPRLALGSNKIFDPVVIDDYEDASCFRQRPPEKVWDRDTGPEGCGSLRLSNGEAKETVWSAEPPTQIPNGKKLNISALVKTEDVEGQGIFIRVRYHTFHWRPGPHVEWKQELESEAVSGTEDWTRITLPELVVPEEDFDHLIWFDVILDGVGTAWLTNIDVALDSVEEEVPEPVKSLT